LGGGERGRGEGDEKEAAVHACQTAAVRLAFNPWLAGVRLRMDDF